MSAFCCKGCREVFEDKPERPCCYTDEGENTPHPVPYEFERLYTPVEGHLMHLIKECLSVETHITQEHAERGDGKWVTVTTSLAWEGEVFYSNEGEAEVLSYFDSRIESLEQGD